MSIVSQVYTIDTKTKNVYKFDEALVLTGFGKYNYLITILCGLICLANIVETMGFSFIVPASQCDLNLSLTQKGWLAAIPYIGLVCSSQMWGYLADTRGRRKILMVSMSLGAISSMLSSLSPNLTVFAVLRFLSAASMAASNAIVQAYYGELTPKSHVDMMISVLSSVIIGSTIVATGIAWGVLTLNFNIPIALLDFSYRPWRLLVLFYALPFLIATVALLKAPESPKYLMSIGRRDKVLIMLRKIYEMNTGKDSSTYPVDVVILDAQDKQVNKSEKKTALETVWDQTAPIFRPPLLKYTLILFLIAFGIYGSGNGMFMWMPDFLDRFYVADENGQIEGKTFCQVMAVRSKLLLTENSSLNNTTAICDDSFKSGTYPSMLLVTVTVTLCNILVVILLKWISKKWILLFVLGAGSFSTFIIYFVTNAYVSWMFIIIFLTTGVIVGILCAFAVESFPTQYRAMAVSIILLFGRVGSIFGTNIVGWLLETNCDLNFFLFSGLLFACFVVGCFLPIKEKNNNESTKL